MNPELEQRLQLLRQDYRETVGSPFRHFFCPMLGVDEASPLQKGHIVNEAFADSARVWVVQRQDVDQFYGTFFESDFELVQYAGRVTRTDVFTDRKLQRKIRPQILRGDQPVAFTTRQGELPSVFTPIRVEDEERSFTLGIKMSPEEILAAAGDKWAFEIKVDLRLAAFVSLVKAAHLTLFHVLGYRYALSAAGILIGRDLLGRFFLENRDKEKEEIRVRALQFFREFQHMVRPVLASGISFDGTVSDNTLFVCMGTSGRIWGFVVFVRTGNRTHAVLLPVFNDPESVPTFLDFMGNSNETIHVSVARFEWNERIWKINPERKALNWTKTGLLFSDPMDWSEVFAEQAESQRQGAADASAKPEAVDPPA
jgi:hypothetical protein